MNTKERAKEAERLSKDPVFMEALTDIRVDALEALAKVDPANANEIIGLQQRVAVIDEISLILARYIQQGKAREINRAVA